MPSTIAGNCKSINEYTDARSQILAQAVVHLINHLQPENPAMDERSNVPSGYNIDKSFLDMASDLNRNGFSAGPSRKFLKFLEHKKKYEQAVETFRFDGMRQKEERIKQVLFSPRNIINMTIVIGESVFVASQMLGYVHLTPVKGLVNSFNILSAGGEFVFSTMRVLLSSEESDQEVKYIKKLSGDLVDAYQGMNMELPEAAQRIVKTYPPF